MTEEERKEVMASIIKRNNKYCVVVNYTDMKGKRKQKWESFDTKKETIDTTPTTIRPPHSIWQIVVICTDLLNRSR